LTVDEVLSTVPTRKPMQDESRSSGLAASSEWRKP
jgi:hypothetical protein